MPIQLFCDFDGTLTTQDTGTIIIDACMGYSTRKSLDASILNGSKTFRDAVTQMWASVDLEWLDALALLSNVQMDPGYSTLLDTIMTLNIPMTIVSSGIDLLVNKFVGQDVQSSNGLITVLANQINLSNSHWEIMYRDDSSYGHDKGQSIRNLRTQDSIVVFVGDGVSDIPAALEADVVFAKRGKDLGPWCLAKGIPFLYWDDLSVISTYLNSIVNHPSPSSSSSIHLKSSKV